MVARERCSTRTANSMRWKYSWFCARSRCSNCRTTRAKQICAFFHPAIFDYRQSWHLETPEKRTNCSPPTRYRFPRVHTTSSFPAIKVRVSDSLPPISPSLSPAASTFEPRENRPILERTIFRPQRKDDKKRSIKEARERTRRAARSASSVVPSEPSFTHRRIKPTRLRHFLRRCRGNGRTRIRKSGRPLRPLASLWKIPRRRRPFLTSSRSLASIGA